MASRSLDVRIVGGGFAGVVTALTLLNGDDAVDCNVTIYEREPKAHTTLCGEGLSDATLRSFNAFDSSPFIAESFDEASWFFPGGLEARIHQKGHTMARERWIPAMAEEAERLGAEYKAGAKVTPEMVEQMAREADVVVGADGPGSVTRKVVGGHHETMLGIQYRVARAGRVPERLEFYTDKTYSPEYSWIFPRGDIVNVGLLAAVRGEGPARGGRGPRGQAEPRLGGDAKGDWDLLDRFMKDKQVEGKIVKREAYPIGFFGDKVQKGNVVLVGDAAGLTNPITKGGMAAAVHTAALLARCLKEGKLEDYERCVFAHPMTDPSFRPALAALRRWSNRDFERLTRLAPRLVHVTPGVSTERRYGLRFAASLLLNAPRLREMRQVSHALGVSREYSW